MTLCTGTAGGVEQRVNRKGDRLDVSLKQTPGLWARSMGQEFRVDFNPGVELELDFHTGATDTTLDLSGLLVNSLDLKTGASSTVITAPERGHTKASIDAGAASVEVRVPESAAARITAEHWSGGGEHRHQSVPAKRRRLRVGRLLDLTQPDRPSHQGWRCQLQGSLRRRTSGIEL